MPRASTPSRSHATGPVQGHPVATRRSGALMMLLTGLFLACGLLVVVVLG